MCDEPMPCACTLERRKQLSGECMERQDALRAMWSKLRDAGALTEAEDDLLLRQVEQEWDDAIHIASVADPLRSLCGHRGRNLADLPDRPGGGEGCWTCLTLADEITKRGNAREVEANG